MEENIENKDFQEAEGTVKNEGDQKPEEGIKNEKAEKVKCKACGKEMDGDTKFCPSCGAAQGEAAQKNIYDTFCILGLAFGIISNFYNFFGVLNFVGVILSIIGLINCKNKKMRAYAVVGICLGVLSIVLMSIRLAMVMKKLNEINNWGY